MTQFQVRSIAELFTLDSKSQQSNWPSLDVTRVLRSVGPGVEGHRKSVHLTDNSIMTHEMEVETFLKERWGAVTNDRVKGDRQEKSKGISYNVRASCG